MTPPTLGYAVNGIVTDGPYKGQFYREACNLPVEYCQTSLLGWKTVVLVDADGVEAIRDIPIKYLDWGK
jgi:hypothetical protein